MQLSEIVAVSQRVQTTARRRDKTAVLATCLKAIAPDEIGIAVHYLTGALPQGRIGIGAAAVRAARTNAGTSLPTLGLREVDAVFAQLTLTVGPRSGERRRALLAALLQRATAGEQDFLLRLIVGELRQGALEGLMLDAIAQAARLPASDVRRALMMAGDLATVARAAIVEGRAGLARFSIRLMQPLKPMLAQTADDVAQALHDLGEAALEYKIDGARVQVHKSGDEVRVFSRRLNEVTTAVPEIARIVAASPARQLIVDGEAIALTPHRRPRSFQTTLRRFGRKLDIARMQTELPLSVFFFDALHVDGEDLIDRPGEERVRALAEVVPETQRIPRRVMTDVEVGDAFLAEALARGHEGVMAKALAAPYEAGNRGSGWRKIKRAHTLDLVVLAAEWGRGRRSGWLSNLHLGARDPRSGGFVMLGKTFKGMTDAMLTQQTQELQRLALGREGDTVHVRPELVVEVAFNDIQASPRYPGGLALRFARIKSYRPDKTAQDADSIDTVRALYARSLPTESAAAAR